MRSMGKLNSGICQIPPKVNPANDDITSSRKSLPIWLQKEEIAQAVAKNQVSEEVN